MTPRRSVAILLTCTCGGKVWLDARSVQIANDFCRWHARPGHKVTETKP